jgi:hypothetical protein
LLKVVALEGGANVGFMLPYNIGAKINVGGRVNTEEADQLSSNVKMSLLPPKKLITMASTQDGGRTLHFKLKQFNQITLEGDKDFAFLAAVPKDWKGDCFMLECTAFLKGTQNAAAQKTLKIGLYNSGDSAARMQVEAAAKAYRPSTPSMNNAPTSIPIKSMVLKGTYRFTGKGPFGLGKLYIEGLFKSDGTWEGFTCVIGDDGKWIPIKGLVVRGRWKIEENALTIEETDTAFSIGPWTPSNCTHVKEDKIMGVDTKKGNISLKSGESVQFVK